MVERMVAVGVERNVIGTVTHINGRSAEIELTIDNRILYTVFDVKHRMIHTGTSTTLHSAGYIVGKLITTI